eukprot:scaffold2621_cov274-Chaetoceros_neogracile.AAC.11
METLLQQHTTFSVVKELKGSWEFKPPSTSLQEHKASKFSSKAQRNLSPATTAYCSEFPGMAKIQFQSRYIAQGNQDTAVARHEEIC